MGRLPMPLKRSPGAFARAVRETLVRRGLAGPGDAVLAAVSAGPDSTALLGALAELRDAGFLASLHALHVDHGLRPGGDEDAACASSACTLLGVPFRSVRVRVAAGNVQAAARRARYRALAEEAARLGATRIATGHTRTDQAETVLMRLLRGAGARGLSAIPPRRGRIVRPLIDRSRSEGLEYVVRRGLPWRDDPTNATPRFLRNRLRAELWPAVLALAPRAEAALARAADLARDDERALAARAARLAPGPGEVPAAPLLAAPAAVRRRVVRRLWRAAGRPAPLGAAQVESVLRLLAPGRPRRIALPAGLEARVRAGALEIGPPLELEAAPPPVTVAGPGRYRAGALTVRVDAVRPGEVPWPLQLRGRLPGDRFRPDRGAGAKKLKGWLIDRKVPREIRDGLLLLAAGRDVVAIPELGAVAQGLGPSGAGLTAQVERGPERARGNLQKR